MSHDKEIAKILKRHGERLRHLESLEAGHGGGPHHPAHEDGGSDEMNVGGLSGELADPQTAKTHKVTHQDGGGDEINLGGLQGIPENPAVVDPGAPAPALGKLWLDTDDPDPGAPPHKDEHKPGGGDAFLSTDLLDAIIKRLQESGGPTNLLMGAVADGQYLRRSGAGITGAAAAAAGEGHVHIDPWSYNSIGQGTWAYAGDTSQHMGDVLNNSTNANGDNISYQLYLDVGTYTLLFFTETASGQGIVDIDINGVEVASFDCYSAAQIRNVRKIEDNISVVTAGVKTLRVRVDGKHGSSTGYLCFIGYIALWRTA